MKKGDASTFAIGVGGYYMMSFFLAFYPALIVSLQVWLWTEFSPIALILTPSAFFIMYIFIRHLLINRIYNCLAIVYLATLYPFIQLISWIYDENSPGFYVDWLP